MKHQDLIFTNSPAVDIDRIVAEAKPSRLFVLVDTDTRKLVLPRIVPQSKSIAEAIVITVDAGDINKNISAVEHIWTELQVGGANRHSMLINLGGGMVTDMGGFAASTFKRGMRFINVPTTLLGAVDAAVGGKTGINFNGLKNEIGVFCEADAVVISTCFFSTLPANELKSGFAEMLKHGLLESTEAFSRLINYDINGTAEDDALLSLLEESVMVKRRVVEQDPHEQGLRKALNLGHTAGHAFESMAMKRQSPIPHGYAVAWGCVVELVLSHIKEQFPSSLLHRLARYVSDAYGMFPLTCEDYPTLLELMHHDKKNTDSAINFTLLGAPGDIRINRTATHDEIQTALDIFRDLNGQ